MGYFFKKRGNRVYLSVENVYLGRVIGDNE